MVYQTTQVLIQHSVQHPTLFMLQNPSKNTALTQGFYWTTAPQNSLCSAQIQHLRRQRLHWPFKKSCSYDLQGLTIAGNCPPQLWFKISKKVILEGSKLKAKGWTLDDWNLELRWGQGHQVSASFTIVLLGLGSTDSDDSERCVPHLF